jgi:hypothetical protein
VPNASRVKHDAFFSAAAQVIPVLLLAVMFEARLFRQGPDRGPATPLDVGLIVGILGLLFVGEFAALKGLDAGYTTARELVVIIGMGVTALMLMIWAMLELTLEHLEDTSPGSTRRFMYASGAGGLAIVATILGVLLV